jgi:2-(1,2-epoxy-1,2-dihydrophenyl)acetyl-CoA isomerase
MTDTPLLYEVGDDHVALITLNRPERMNALTPELVDLWEQALIAARADPAVRVVMVTGAGRGFCAGADLRPATPGGPPAEADNSAAARRNVLRYGFHRIARALRLLDKPYLAAVNGAATGAGMDMASMADLRFASETARFGMVYMKIGLVPGNGGAFFLPRLVGIQRALELIWSGDLFTAQQALEWGYVSRVYPPDDLLPEVRAYARRLAEAPPVAVQLAKRLVYRSAEVTEDQALDLAQSALAIVSATEDAIEGRRAFAERRPPRFLGR